MLVDTYNASHKTDKQLTHVSFIAHSRGCALIAKIISHLVKEGVLVRNATYLDPVNKNKGWETSKQIVKDTKSLIYDEKRNYPIMFVLKGNSSKPNYNSYADALFGAVKKKSFNKDREVAWTKNTFIAVSNTAHEHMLDQDILNKLGEERHSIIFDSK